MPELRLKSDNTKAFADELFGEDVKGIIGDYLWKFKQDTIGFVGVKKKLKQQKKI